MDVKLKNKKAQLNQMLITLDRGINLYEKKCITFDAENPDAVDELAAFRDSVIQRFEYCTDGFWKIIKIYLEQIEGITLETTGPKPIARTAALHHVISEEESAALIQMIEERNKTSHIYQEEIADEIAKSAPKALLLMQTILNRLAKKIDA